jgi:hypothetical protein
MRHRITVNRNYTVRTGIKQAARIAACAEGTVKPSA